LAADGDLCSSEEAEEPAAEAAAAAAAAEEEACNGSGLTALPGASDLMDGASESANSELPGEAKGTCEELMPLPTADAADAEEEEEEEVEACRGEGDRGGTMGGGGG
jgi:hypothetical protein